MDFNAVKSTLRVKLWPCRAKILQQHLFSGEAKPAVTNWADTDDEDDFDDDIGPLPSSWVRLVSTIHEFTALIVFA